MDIRYLKRNEIDDTLWNNVIEKSIHSLIYAYAWYLDTTTNRKWDALVCNNYEYIMPLPYKIKYTISYVFTPFISQQLGILGETECPTNIVAAFFQSIPQKYKIVEISAANNVSMVTGYNKVERHNQHINLDENYADISRKYRRNTKRNIKEAESRLAVKQGVEISDFLKFQYKWEPGKFTFKHKNVTKQLINAMLQKCNVVIYGAFFNEEIVGVMLCAVHRKTIYSMLASANTIGRKYNAHYMIFDTIIKQYSASGYVFDFCGSSISQITYRNMGFGAINKEYTLLIREKLPQIIKWIKKTVKGK